MKSVDFTLLLLAMILQRTQNFTVDMNQVLLIIRNNRVMYAGINMFWVRLGVILAPDTRLSGLKWLREGHETYLWQQNNLNKYLRQVFSLLWRIINGFFSTYTIIGQFSQPYFTVRPAKFKRLLEFKYSSAIWIK